MHVNAPKGKLPTDLRAQIAKRKAEILALLRRRSSSKRIAAPPIMPRATGEPAPLSFAQERLWFLEQLEPESAVYNVRRASRLVGNLNTSALEASLNEIISRHETLRTAFRLINGRPLQVVQPTGRISIDFTDLRSVPESERDADIQRRIKAETECPFDLTTGFLLRCKLLRVSDEEHVLILMTHHSASDAWSMGLLTRELWTLYQAFLNGKPSPLEPLPVQYSDYAVWQRNWFQGEVMNTQLAYWKKQLGDLSLLNLPTDRPRTPRQSFSGARLSILLPEALTRSVNEMSHRYAVTPFMTLLAAFQVLLYRYTGQEDIVIGSPVANRRRSEIESLIGFFVNTLVLRAKLSGNLSFSELLLRVRDICVAAHANQDLPFEKLVLELQPERDLSRNPLFQVMFVLQNATSPFTDFSGLRVEPIEIETTHSPFDLSFFLRERNGKFIGYFEYSTDLFERATIERMAGHYQTLIEGIVADPDQPIATLPILSETERHQILVEWNDTAADYPKDKCIHELFEEQAERTPNAVAVEFEGQLVTYRELNEGANRLGHLLTSLGVGPEKLVGICVERSIEMVVGLLGILKAGGAYLPLDPAYPKERLVFMARDAGLTTVLAQQRTADQIATLGSRVFCLDSELFGIIPQKNTAPVGKATAQNLAFVIYTSGSTGRPKGVMVSHRSVVNHIYWAQRRFPLSVEDSVVQKTTLNFDASVWEIFAPLLTGARLVLALPGGQQDSAYLVNLLAEQKITVLKIVPSLLDVLLEENLENCKTLRHVLCGGESLTVDLQRRFVERSAAILHNLYGPTEATIDATCWSSGFKAVERSVPIGRPIANSEIYLLDSNLQPVPVGVTGELYIGGAGVARGYLNRPELTKDKFISNPFSDDPASRIYRTGDLARYLPGGNIEFLGRCDNQLKIRGFRIELGEIETVLNQHLAVKESVVVARDRDGLSEKQLVGFIVPLEASPSFVDDVREYLTEKLPAFMVPSAFVILEGLPVTLSGKTDRAKLSLPAESRSYLNDVAIPPRTDIEELVANIWREVLRIENLGIYDNFFTMGGHSLLATQIVSRLEEACHKEVPLRLLFHAPTIAGLAQELENILREGNAPRLPPLVPVPRVGPLPLSMNQEQLWRLSQMLPDAPFLNMPYIYRMRGNLDVSALERSLKELIRRHEALRTLFTELNGCPVQIVKPSVDFQLDVIDLQSCPPKKMKDRTAKLILEERMRSFDLASAPLFRTKLLRLTNDGYLLLLTVHHIISDRWSTGIFRRELTTFYRNFCEGKPSLLPEPPIQLADFAYWERSLLDNGLLNKQLAYWKKQLANPPPPLKFQGKNNTCSEIGIRSSRYPIHIEESLFKAIKAFAQKENCTPFMVVLTALNMVLYLYTGQEDIRIGTLAANRGLRETETAIGHFLNTVVLRTRVAPNVTVKELLAQVREVTLAAHAHQELPFEYLAQHLDEENVGRGSLFQVLCNYHNVSAESFELPGLKIASWDARMNGLDSEVAVTTFDLIFELKESSRTLTGAVSYNVNVFDHVVIGGMIDRLRDVLKEMIIYPGRRISSSQFAVSAERN